MCRQHATAAARRVSPECRLARPIVFAVAAVDLVRCEDVGVDRYVIRSLAKHERCRRSRRRELGEQ
jgi:hypothetical protein